MERIKLGKVVRRYKPGDLLSIQLESFYKFMKVGLSPQERKQTGLYKLFQEHFPITDSRNYFVLEFIDYDLIPPIYSPEECKERQITYAATLKVRLRLSCTDPHHEDFETSEQDVFLGEVPYITERGTFIINGVERVVVNQIQRAPGVYFGRIPFPGGKMTYYALVIPLKGAWLEFTTDTNGVLYAYIERKNKVLGTVLLRAIGLESNADILKAFGLAEEVNLRVKEKELERYYGRELATDALKTWYEEFADKGGGEMYQIERSEVILPRGTKLKKEHIKLLLENQIDRVFVKVENEELDGDIIYRTLEKDLTRNKNEACVAIYKAVRNTEPSEESSAENLLEKLMFSEQRYDLGAVGRYNLNRKLGLKIRPENRVLTREDIIAIFRQICRNSKIKSEQDDIDHLGNKILFTVGDFMYMQYSVGMSRLAKVIRDRMNVRDSEVFTPVELVSAKIFTTPIYTFFNSGQLAQLMDQTNILSETTHKRRVTVLGMGGLTHETAGFEVRDIKYSQYGRLCPVETPEGHNIGLLSSLAIYARVNSAGFIETPYWIVENGRVRFDLPPVYLTADEEEDKIIAEGNIPVDENGNITAQYIRARKGGNYLIVSPSNVQLMDVMPDQIFSLSTSLIPFVNHDEGNRALMGSNMQRQAVPLLKPEAPLVGTGMEKIVCENSKWIPYAQYDGVVEYVDAEKIIIRYELDDDEKLVSFDEEVEIKLPKFIMSNNHTLINLKPIVRKGERVKKGQPLCEGFGTEKGELALGTNLLVAFMPWRGYNFEDAIVVSERLVRDDVLTSIHVVDFSASISELPGAEETLTNDIIVLRDEDRPTYLNPNGLPVEGTYLKEGKIVIGKITQRMDDSEASLENKLLYAIFGERAFNQRDCSERMPPGTKGTVIKSQLFERMSVIGKKGVEVKSRLAQISKTYETEIMKLKKKCIQKLLAVVGGQASQGISNYFGEVVVKRGVKIDEKVLENLDLMNVVSEGWTMDENKNAIVEKILANFRRKYNEIIAKRKREEYELYNGDMLPVGITKIARVLVADVRKIQVGDKLAGRHGNKGVVSKVAPIEDMPFLEDGTPVDVVLNPLGVPSRMNIGQILETILGWVAHKMGVKFEVPVFEKISIEELAKLCEKAGVPYLGQCKLRDGLTGEEFHQKTTVGIMYIMKLHHMVEDKIHARSTGPYSVTIQQPLGGKVRFGGQRLGEMEVWALEAYGAAHTLREMLTIKSDDIEGRLKASEAIIENKPITEYNVPESFKVLINELRAMNIDIQFE